MFWNWKELLVVFPMFCIWGYYMHAGSPLFTILHGISGCVGFQIGKYILLRFKIFKK